MVLYIYFIICIGAAFFLAIVGDGFGGTILLGAILAVLLAIYHQLVKIYDKLNGEAEDKKPHKPKSRAPIRY
ncbi:hypothetical protein [Thalassobacillus hwangdonensis]|uniref:Uncharacterized protein n=1 Tax=Thalassobacillus hwangdonensis TaxID=546108 RepID=A0ABW3L3Z4_9BACI